MAQRFPVLQREVGCAGRGLGLNPVGAKGRADAVEVGVGFDVEVGVGFVVGATATAAPPVGVNGRPVVDAPAA